MNSYQTIGRLTRDPETRFTTSGKSITSFDIAVDVGFGQNKKTVFWSCKIWGERGETFVKYVAKGHQVGIESSIDQEEWKDKSTGEDRKKLVLNVNNFTLISNGEKKTSNEDHARQKMHGSEAPARTTRNIPRAQPQEQDHTDTSEIPW
jgi:single-strand DNA-binding protein